MLDTLLDLKGDVPFTSAGVTIRHRQRGPDRPLHTYRMDPQVVRSGIVDFIQSSADFRAVTERPREILDWETRPAFLDSPFGRALLSAGFTQGVSLAFVTGDRVTGSLHLNVSHTSVFSDAELSAIDRARADLGHLVSGLVVAGVFSLSPRENDVLARVADGATTAQIADLLTVSRRTIDSHVESIIRKLGASNRVQAVRIAVELGIV